MFLSRLLLTKIECRLVILSWILLPVLVLCTVNPVLFGVEINNYLVLQPPYDRAYGYARGEQDLNSRTDYNHSEDTTTGKVYVKAVSESECPLFSPPFGGGGATAYSSLFPARVKCIHTSDYKITFYFNIKGNAGVDNGSLIDWLNPIPSNAAAKAKVTLGALVYDVDEDYKVILEKEREIYDRELAWFPSLFSSFEYFDEDVTISETISLTQGHEYLLEGHINAVVTTSAIGMAGAKAIAMFDSETIHWGEFLIPVDGYMELQSIVLEDLFPVEQPELLAHWNFDEGSGSIASDSSGNRKDGIIYGATWTTGKIGNALNFDGVDDWVDIPDDISPEHITLTAWIYPTGVYDIGDHGSPIFTKETGRGTPPWSESFAWRLRITPHTHKLQLQCFSPTGVGGGSAVSDTVLQMGDWYHVAGTYDGTQTRVYINGNLEGGYTAPTSEPLVTSSLQTAIGHLPNWSVQWFQGSVDEARIYSKALSDSEIKALVYEHDIDGDGIPNDIENATGTNPSDDDTDDDGLLDGPGSGEDANANGVVDPGETDPRSEDTDGDGIQDGTERGLVAPEGFDTNLTIFVPDADPSSTTDATNPDTDGDGRPDGEEDVNKNGKADPGESNPNVITGVMNVEPNTLNLKSKGWWVSCYIELPKGYDVGNIDVSTIMLNEQVPSELRPIEIGDYGDDGVPDLMVKFDRSAVQEILEAGNEVEITMTGELTDGTLFEGSDTIRVIDKGGKK